jgi:hypothetical protein
MTLTSCLKISVCRHKHCVNDMRRNCDQTCPMSLGTTRRLTCGLIFSSAHLDRPVLARKLDTMLPFVRKFRLGCGLQR